MKNNKEFAASIGERWDKATAQRRMQLKLMIFTATLTLIALITVLVSKMVAWDTYSQSDVHLHAGFQKAIVGLAFGGISILALFFGAFQLYIKWAWQPYHEAFMQMVDEGEQPEVARQKTTKLWQAKALGRRRFF